jgi:acyl-CoA thioesterase-1
MSSIAAAYGPGTRLRKAVAVLMTLLTLGARADAASPPVRLLILGDSLTAGYGLAQGEAFQAQLLAALTARGVAVRLIDGAVSGDTSAGDRGTRRQ